MITACRAKVASNSRANIDETDLDDGVVKIPPQTFVGWMLGYPILYYYGLNQKKMRGVECTCRCTKAFTVFTGEN